MEIISILVALFMACIVIFIRMKASEKPVSAKKIILPPLFMSTGALMFLFPVFHVSGIEFIEAVIVGLIFSIVLIKTSKFEVRDHHIYLKRSKAFGIVLITLLIIRICLKLYLSQSIEVGVLAGMFYLLAIGMIVPWRISMLLTYKKIESELTRIKVNL
jgi:membrane protein CcdC involved in cytochrome C biogenesis